MGKKGVTFHQRDPNINHPIISIAGAKNNKSGKKIKDVKGLKGALGHALRLEGVDHGNTHKHRQGLNYEIFHQSSSLDDAVERFEAITAGLERRAKNGQQKVLVEDLLFTTSPGWWNRDENGFYDEKDPENIEKLGKWVEETRAFIADTFGAENVVFANVQLDETTPHISAFVVPIRTDKQGNKHISHHHYFDGKKQVGDKSIQKLNHYFYRYEKRITKAFPDLEPCHGLKVKKGPDGEKLAVRKNDIAAKARTSVKDYYSVVHSDLVEAKETLAAIRADIDRKREVKDGLDKKMDIQIQQHKDDLEKVQEETRKTAETKKKLDLEIEAGEQFLKSRLAKKWLKQLDKAYNAEAKLAKAVENSSKVKVIKTARRKAFKSNEKLAEIADKVKKTPEWAVFNKHKPKYGNRLIDKIENTSTTPRVRNNKKNGPSGP